MPTVRMNTRYMTHRYYWNLEEKAKVNQLRIVDVSADGNCFFSAVSHMLRYNYDFIISGQKIRQDLVQHISNKEEYGQRFTRVFSNDSFKTYLEKLKGLEWADDFAITATAEMLGIRIKILKDAGNWIVINDDRRLREIKIGHIPEIHYVALENIENIDYQNMLKTGKKQKLPMVIENTLQDLSQTQKENYNESTDKPEATKKSPMTTADRKHTSRAKKSIEKNKSTTAAERKDKTSQDLSQKEKEKYSECTDISDAPKKSPMTPADRKRVSTDKK